MLRFYEKFQTLVAYEDGALTSTLIHSYAALHFAPSYFIRAIVLPFTDFSSAILLSLCPVTDQ